MTTTSRTPERLFPATPALTAPLPSSVEQPVGDDTADSAMGTWPRSRVPTMAQMMIIASAIRIVW